MFPLQTIPEGSLDNCSSCALVKDETQRKEFLRRARRLWRAVFVGHRLSAQVDKVGDKVHDKASTKVHGEGARWITRLVAVVTIALLAQCLVSALNARATYSYATGTFAYHPKNGGWSHGITRRGHTKRR